jgi:hypothetical protein
MMNVINKVVSPSFYEKKNLKLGLKKFSKFCEIWLKKIFKKIFANVLANLKKNEKKIFEIFKKKEFFEVFFIF